MSKERTYGRRRRRSRRRSTRNRHERVQGSTRRDARDTSRKRRQQFDELALFAWLLEKKVALAATFCQREGSGRSIPEAVTLALRGVAVDLDDARARLLGGAAAPCGNSGRTSSSPPSSFSQQQSPGRHVIGYSRGRART